MKYSKICDVCGVAFSTNISTKLYCSAKCRKRQYKRLKNIRDTEARRIEVVCPICQTTFKTSFGQKFCDNCSKEGYKLSEENWKLKHKDRMKELRARYMHSEHGKTHKKEDYVKTATETKEQSILSGTYKSFYGQNEDRFILDNWNKMTKKEIAKKLNRTYSSIISRYIKLTKGQNG